MSNQEPARAPATSNEIVAAVVRGALPTLLLTKRMALPAATGALRELERFVGPDDARLHALREQVTALSESPLRTKSARQVGESVVYKTQRPGTKKSSHVVVPVNVLQKGLPLTQVRVTFGSDSIVITRVGETEAP
jgi:hypothetical protein